MKTLIAKLTDILTAETECYREMEPLLDREKAAVSLSRHDDFESIQDQKARLVAALQRCESDRLQVVRQLADALAIAAPAVTIRDLASNLDLPEGNELEASCDRLRRLIDKIREKNQRNQRLIKHYRELVNGSMQLLSGLLNEAPVYPGPGTGAPAPGYAGNRGRLLCRNI
jgi:flagellar biosynthesis/type III secretory pathway chaperone